MIKIYWKVILACATVGPILVFPQRAEAQQSRVFLTSTTSTGELGGLAGADQSCQARATAGGLGGGPWVAWLSTSTTNAVDRLVPESGPFIRAVSGLTIANDIQDLTDGTLCNPIIHDEFGSSWVHFAWTGTAADGTRTNYRCDDWTEGSQPNQATYGYNPGIVESWTDNGQTTCASGLNLYCFETPESPTAIFSDGFESTNSCRWSLEEPYGGHPCADFSFTVSGLQVAFQDLSEGVEPLSFQWDFGDGSQPVQEENPVHTYGVWDDYQVALTTLNSLGADTNVKKVVVCRF